MNNFQVSIAADNSVSVISETGTFTKKYTLAAGAIAGAKKCMFDQKFKINIILYLTISFFYKLP